MCSSRVIASSLEKTVLINFLIAKYKFFNLQKEDSLSRKDSLESIVDKVAGPNVSFIRKFHCTTNMAPKKDSLYDQKVHFSHTLNQSLLHLHGNNLYSVQSTNRIWEIGELLLSFANNYDQYQC